MRDLPPRVSGARRHSGDAAGRGHDRAGIVPQGKLPKHKETELRMRKSPAESLARLKHLIPRLRGKRIGVVGDLMLDRYLWGTASRLSPEAAVPVVDFVSQSERLGGAGNVAANLAALGAKVET